MSTSKAAFKIPARYEKFEWTPELGAGPTNLTCTFIRSHRLTFSILVAYLGKINALSQFYFISEPYRHIEATRVPSRKEVVKYALCRVQPVPGRGQHLSTTSKQGVSPQRQTKLLRTIVHTERHTDPRPVTFLCPDTRQGLAIARQ